MGSAAEYCMQFETERPCSPLIHIDQPHLLPHKQRHGHLLEEQVKCPFTN